MKIKLFILIFTLLLLAQGVFAQENKEIQTSDKQSSKLIDLFGKITAEDASARIDGLLYEVQKNPNSKGILFVYCGKNCQYGEVEAHIRGIKLKLNFRGVNNDRYLILPGGYREETQTELWFVSENACPPIPHSTVNIEDVKFKGNYKRKIVYYDCC